MNKVKIKTTKNTADDYKLIKKYDVNISGIEKLVVLVSEGNLIKYYVYNDQLFQFLNETHVFVKHGGRNRIEYELNLKYKNITRETTMIFLN